MLNPYLKLSCVALIGVILVLFPGASALPMLLMFLGVGLIVRFAYRRLCIPTTMGAGVLLAAWTMLAAGVAVNVWYFTTYSGGADYAPVLLNNDARTAWEQMQALQSGTVHPAGYRLRGFAQVLVALTCGGTPTISGLLVLNMLATLLTIVITGAISEKAAKGSGQYAMLAIAAVSYFMASGAILVKDAMVCLTMAAWLFVWLGGHRTGAFITMAACIVAAFFIRPHLLPFMAVAAALLTLADFKRLLPILCISIAVIAAVYIYASHIETAQRIFWNSDETAIEIGSERVRLAAYNTVSAGYQWLPLWAKIVRLPFSLAVQFLTPLPWAFGRDIVFGPTQAWAHFAFPWYAAGGAFLFYLGFSFRRSPLAIKLLAIFAALAWCATAFVSGGTISRYCLPWLPALVPAVAWLVKSRQWQRPIFRKWAIAYSALLIIGLIVVFHTLNVYSPGGWEAV